MREITPKTRRLETYVTLLVLAIVMTTLIGIQTAKRFATEQHHRVHPAHSPRAH